jgi:F-type H+-transporting ATPase subunit gamma
MPSLKHIRRRISSVKSTQKITRAMKMVAAAKLRKAQETTERFRKYADATAAMLAEVASDAGGEEHPLLERRPVDSALVLVISSDRGLCGGFNTNLNRLVGAHLKEQAKAPALAIVGKKAMAYFHRRDAIIAEQFVDVYSEPGYAVAARIARRLIAKYTSGEVDRIDIAYNEMLSVASQKPTIRPLLPIELPAAVEGGSGQEGLAGTYLFEPDAEKLLAKILPMYVEVAVCRALLESIAAEHASRMAAMDAATTNAQDMIEHLTLVYNRARQSAITSELMDIVGGAEALD